MSKPKQNKVANAPGLDPTLPDVSVEIKGIEYQLSFSFNAVVLAEKATGINLLTSIVSDITATSLLGLFWAALITDKPSITIEEAGNLITPQNVGTIRAALITAWFGSVKVSDQGEDSAPAK
jgi:hypothetical protein